MNINELPPNPYSRQPIKKSVNLAGRSSELEKIDYYLRLTSEGQSPHLALIGPRGVGKTSMLNAIEDLAEKRRLLTVRINMNEDKGHSPGIFWRDLYGSMCSATAKVGGWGGVQNPIYSALVGMLFAHKMPEMQLAVLQFPLITANYSQDLNTMSCPDALIINDLETIKEEIGSRGFTGVVILIDEADCLGLNRSLMQVLRNIFQVIDGYSLVLAGTEAVFPTLTEVFSPIPRQFHRIDIKPFSHWGKTYELIRKPISDDTNKIMPEMSTVLSLHELCGGDPAELQLYCHHMYKQIEEGSAEEMELRPQVYREVLREYRANTPSDVEAVLDAIQDLPDSLLFMNPMLRMRRLSRTEVSQLAIFVRQLNEKRLITLDEKLLSNSEIEECFHSLFERGITVSMESLCLKGSPITDGYWKSYVEAEKDESWAWDDETYPEAILEAVVACLSAELFRSDRPVINTETTETQGNNKATSVQILQRLRSGERIHEVPSLAYWELALFKSMASSALYNDVVDVELEFVFKGTKEVVRVSFIGQAESSSAIEEMNSWLLSVAPTLTEYNIYSLQLSARQWTLPTDDELAMLSWITGMPATSRKHGNSILDKAYKLFSDNEIVKAIDVFKEMLEYRDDETVRNNLAYCQIIIGDLEEAQKSLASLVANGFDVLWEHNLAIVEAILGNTQASINRLQNILTGLEIPFTSPKNCDAFCMLLLSHGCTKAVSIDHLPKPAAILLNLYRLGAITLEEVTVQITHNFPETYEQWLLLIVE